MSDSISRMHDDYEEYVTLCEGLGVEPLPLFRDYTDKYSRSFYDHEKELKVEHNLYKNFYGKYKPNKKDE